MKITKYNQSCLLIETNGKRILVDPGSIGYSEDILKNDWTKINIILVTHKHADHCNVDAINAIIKRDRAKLYTSEEVIFTHKFDDKEHVNEVEKGNIFTIDNIKIEVTKAIHGFLTPMKLDNKEVKENIGYIIDDGTTRVYVTSDTINFNNNYSCDVLCMPFNGNGLTLGLVDGIGFIQGINPKIVLPIHMEHPNPVMNPSIDVLKEILEKENIKYKILKLRESYEI